ncbi:ArsR family transcriptional regulator [Paenibacillus psychroresistens]|uniref:ArsR family transcriptional regulator n=1 Tax=Paenibacillus psychroresistens TaxID=1778678 RepID=A0A6B8RFW9_9BACL|nr:ArsR family transcriptional regulator [Paenibacillus psychroresistens]QGQ94318.1 ArsR family transcriptional regulator [Paenibacillus psychroresistens]
MQPKDSTKIISPVKLQEVAKALSGDLRLRILEILGKQTLSVTQLMTELGVAQPTISINVQILEQAELITTSQGANREKLCSRVHDSLLLLLPSALGDALHEMEEIMMPIGMYTDCSITPTCGMAGKDGLIGSPDDPRSFYLPERSEAELLWFSESGFVEYRFPNPMPPGIELSALVLSAELCSEALGYDEDWPSDITVFINGKRLGTITSPGDYGKEKGSLTPSWWMPGSTQYGQLCEWRIDKVASFCNKEKVSDLQLQDLNLNFTKPITVRFEVEETAKNRRGLNLFGATFGNHSQAIKLSFVRERK